MPLALSTPAIFLIATVGWIALALFFGTLVGKVIHRAAPPDFEPQGREQLGLLEQDAVERQVRIERAKARHGDRRGRAA